MRELVGAAAWKADTLRCDPFVCGQGRLARQCRKLWRTGGDGTGLIPEGNRAKSVAGVAPGQHPHDMMAPGLARKIRGFRRAARLTVNQTIPGLNVWSPPLV